WIYGFAFLLGTFLFFFRSFLLKLRPGWLLHTHTLTKRLTVLACSDNTKEVRTPSSFDFWLFFPLCLYDFFFMSKYWPISPVGRTDPASTAGTETQTQDRQCRVVYL